MISSSLRLAFLVVLLSIAACATGRPPTNIAATPQQTEQGRPLNDAELRVHNARQARTRAGYHAAFDERSVIMIDLIEGSATGAWYISHNLVEPEPRNGEFEPQINESCYINAVSRPTCAVIIPPHYPTFYLYMSSVDRSVNEPFTGRLRVRRGTGEVVEYRTGRFETSTGTSIMVPSSLMDPTPDTTAATH